MYKTILLHVDRGAALAARQRIAAGLALRHGARLVGCAIAGVPPGDYAMAAGSPLAPLPLAEFPGLLEEAKAALQHFADEAHRLGVGAVDTHVLAGHAGKALVAQSAYADLVVTGQDSGAAVRTGIAAGIPDYVALHGACPVLMVPDGCRTRTGTGTSGGTGRGTGGGTGAGTIGITGGGASESTGGNAGGAIGQRIVVGWNGTLEAARAVRGALPLLREAELVQVAVVNPRPPCGREAALDLAAWLACHGAHAEVVVAQASSSEGDALLHLARSGGAGLVVAGAYGHNRFRELVAGGATRTLLDNPDTCILLAH